MDDLEQIEFRVWKARKEEEQRKRGAYWTSPEGRKEIREIWGYDDDDGATVTPLLNALEAAEAQLAATRAECERLRAKIKEAKDDLEAKPPRTFEAWTHLEAAFIFDESLATPDASTEPREPGEEVTSG